MDAEKILRDRIAVLEKEEAKIRARQDKIAESDYAKRVAALIELEKIKYAINTLYTCLGQVE